MSQFKIREILSQHDVPFLWDMLYESLYVPEGEQPFDRAILNEPFLVKYVENWGREGDLGFIATTAEGEAVGSITVRYFSESNKGFGYVADNVPELGMAIKEGYRGLGIGTKLLETLIHRLKEQKVKRLSLSVDPHNLPAMKLYQRFGFKEVGKIDTSIIMVTELNPY